MSFSKINYGVVGTGHIGNFHTQQIKNIKNHANLIGVYDINYEQAKKINKTFIQGYCYPCFLLFQFFFFVWFLYLVLKLKVQKDGWIFPFFQDFNPSS